MPSATVTAQKWCALSKQNSGEEEPGDRPQFFDALSTTLPRPNQSSDDALSSEDISSKAEGASDATTSLPERVERIFMLDDNFFRSPFLRHKIPGLLFSNGTRGMEPILRDVNGNNSNERNSPVPTTTTIPPTPTTNDFHRRHSAPRHHNFQHHYDADSKDRLPNTVNSNNNIDSGDYAAGGSGGGGSSANNSGKVSVVRNIPIQVLGGGSGTTMLRSTSTIHNNKNINSGLSSSHAYRDGTVSTSYYDDRSNSSSGEGTKGDDSSLTSLQSAPPDIWQHNQRQQPCMSRSARSTLALVDDRDDEEEGELPKDANNNPTISLLRENYPRKSSAAARVTFSDDHPTNGYNSLAITGQMGTSLIETNALTCTGGRKSPAARLRQQPFTTVAAPQRYRSVPIIQQQSAITPPAYRNGRDQTSISSNNDSRIPYEHSRTPTTSNASTASSYSAMPIRIVNGSVSAPVIRTHYSASPTPLRTASGHQRERAMTPINTTTKSSSVTASQKASQSLPPPPFLRRTQTAHAISPSDLPRRAINQTPSANRDSIHSVGANADRPLPAIPSTGQDVRASRHSLHESQLRQNSNNGTNGSVKNTDKSSLSAAASTSSLAGNSETAPSRKASKTPSLASLRFGGGSSAGAKVRQKKATFCIRRNDGSDEEDQLICAAEEEAAAAADAADRRSRSLSLSGSTLRLTEFVPKHEDDEKEITLKNGKTANGGVTPVLVDSVEDAIRSLEAFDPNDYIRYLTDAKTSIPHQQKYVKNSQQLQQPRSQKYSTINSHQQQQQQKPSHYLNNVDDDDLPPPPFLNNYGSGGGGGETVVNSALSPTNSSSGVVSDVNTDNPRISTISSSSFSSNSVDAGSASTEPAVNTSSGSEDPSSDGCNSNNRSTPSSVTCLRWTDNNSGGGRLAAWAEKRDSGIRRSNNYSSSGSATPTFGHSHESAAAGQPQQRHSRATTPVATPIPMGNQNGGVAQRSSANYTPILIKRPVFRNSSVEPPPSNSNPTSGGYRSRTPNDLNVNGHYDNVMAQAAGLQPTSDAVVSDAAAADAEAHLRKRFLCTQLTDCAKVVEINAHKMNQFTTVSANGGTSTVESSRWRQPHILRFNLAAIRDTMYTIEFALEELLEALARVAIDPFDSKYEEYRRLCAPLHSSLDMIQRLRVRIDAGGWSLAALARDDSSARYHEDALDQFVAILRHLPRDCYKLVQWIYLLNVWNSGSGSAVFLSTSNSSAGPVPPPPAPTMSTLNGHNVNYGDRLASILKDSQRCDRRSAGEAQPYLNGVDGVGAAAMRRLTATPIANHIVAGYNNSPKTNNNYQHHGVRFNTNGVNSVSNDIHNVTRSRTPLIKFPSTPRLNNGIVELAAANPQPSPHVMDGGESTTSSTSSSTILEDSSPPPPPSKQEKMEKLPKNGVPLKAVNGATSAVNFQPERKHSSGSVVSEDSTPAAHQQTVYEEDDLMSVVSGSVDGSLYGDYPTIDEMRNSYTSPTIWKQSRQPQSASLRRAQNAAVARTVRGSLRAEEREVLRFYEPQIDNNTDELWRLVEDFFNAVEDNTPSSSANNKHSAKSVVQKIQMICIKAQTLVCIARMVARDDALGASPKQQLRKFLDSEASKLEELLNECIANAKIAKEMRQSVAAAQAMISSVVGVSQTALHLKQFWKSCV